MARIQHSSREIEGFGLVDVQYVYYPGVPELEPSFSSGGQPREPAEVEILHIITLSGDDVIALISNQEHNSLLDRLLEDES